MVIKLAIVAVLAAGVAYAWVNGWVFQREERIRQQHAGLAS